LNRSEQRLFNHIFKPAIQVSRLNHVIAARRVAISWKAAMETGNISKPVAAATAAPARVEHLIAAGAVKTELAPEAAVQQVEKTAAVQFAPTQGADFSASLDATMRDVVKRNITIDPRTREIVFQAINQETGEVVRQIPDEAMLRLRAYIREMREAEDKGRASNDVRRVEKIA
jgi:flagellar protein FlaG